MTKYNLLVGPNVSNFSPPSGANPFAGKHYYSYEFFSDGSCSPESLLDTIYDWMAGKLLEPGYNKLELIHFEIENHETGFTERFIQGKLKHLKLALVLDGAYATMFLVVRVED